MEQLLEKNYVAKPTLPSVKCHYGANRNMSIDFSNGIELLVVPLFNSDRCDLEDIANVDTLLLRKGSKILSYVLHQTDAFSPEDKKYEASGFYSDGSINRSDFSNILKVAKEYVNTNCDPTDREYVVFNQYLPEILEFLPNGRYKPHEEKSELVMELDLSV